MNKRNLIVAEIIIFIIGAGVVLYYVSGGNQNTANQTAYITVTASPSDSSVTLNGKSGTTGLNHVAPGDYKVTISHGGFASASKTVTAANGKDAAVAIALVPNTTSTVNWYSTHPKDAAIAQTVTEAKNNSAPANPRSPSSLASLLPFESWGDNHFVVAQDPDSTDPNNPLIYVEADTQPAQDDALTWLKNQGYDPAKLNIKYTTTTDPSRP